MGVQNSNLKSFFTKSSFQNQEWVTSLQVLDQRGPMGMAKTNQCVAKAMGYFPQTIAEGPVAENNNLTTSF